MKYTQVIVLLVAIMAVVAASPLENTRVKRQWGMPWGGYGGMPYGGFHHYGYGYGGYGHRWRRPYVQKTVVVHHYGPWRS
ncbi:hypothetical protein OESDEN_00039 [Oesophagostomum dentatum]|uniref:Sulfur globule protein CV3 domain protein n=1 Tax=Oesophagostomum dentatum TaxID=61180 RepID=A0A0B1TV05_OESDE|nr:hypothetical protein OESDEN_00039 [Oesophagostomum dentatum]